ncbi:Uncharacterized protein FKW44_016079, partial [Caligus rogercresseyi]
MECFVKDCPNHSGMTVEGLRFLEFPWKRDLLKHDAWIGSLAAGYEDHPSPSSESRICNGHFFRKDSAASLDPEHPSYKPLFFPSMSKEEIKQLRKSCRERLHQVKK